jgi:uncharacterized protein (DUF885 family)
MSESHAGELLSRAPEWATQISAAERIAGQGYQGKLSRYDQPSLAGERLLIERLRDELHSFKRRHLTGDAALTYDILDNAYSLAERSNQFGTGLPAWLSLAPPYVINQLSGPHISLPRLLINQHKISDVKDARAFLNRLGDIERVLDEIIVALGVDARQGVVPPAFVLDGVFRSTQKFRAASPEYHPIARAFSDQLDALDSPLEERDWLVDRVQALLRDEVYPAYERLGQAVRALRAETRAGAGVWRLPNGAERYRLALEAYGANGRSADQVHQLGLDEVARIHAEMAPLLNDLGYAEGSIGERLQKLSTAPSMQFENTSEGRQEIIDTIRDYLGKALDAAPQWFARVPTQPVTVRPIPSYEQDVSSLAYYLAPAPDGSRPGFLMINLKDTADWPRYTLRSITHHEAVPGHHFQASLKQAAQSDSTIRTMMFFSEFGEGWALYAEALAKEMGLYKNDPLGDLGRLRAEVYRATRLVVDTGLHHKRWTRREAIDWMVAATGEARPAVAREIERYAVLPGQATSYKLGMINFQRLRRDAEEALGQQFSISAFHDLVLSAGSMPMPVLEQRVKEWIATQQRKSKQR